VEQLESFDHNECGRGPKKKNGTLKKRKLASAILLIIGVCLLALSIKSMLPPVPTESEPIQPVPVQPTESSSADEPLYDEEYLKDKLYITQERANYQSGQMVLKIPRMGVDTAVQAGVSNEYLDISPGLFDYAQLPGGENHNVSIGGHRDIKGAHFYFIHKLTAGDLCYLVYNNNIYVYEYKDTKIIEPSDWGPIYGQGFECLTLISCTPIGTTRQRIVVRAQLKATVPYTEDYSYRPWVEGMEKPFAWERDAKSWDADLQNSPDEEASKAAQQDKTASGEE